MKLKVIAICLVILATLMVATGPALAAEFISPSKGTGSVTVGPEEHRNVYTAGGNVNVSGRVAGDLVAAGGMVTVNAPIESDLIAAGGTLLINNPVGGDARLAGGNITVNSAVTGDLVIGGGNVTIASGASVGGDLISGTGNLEVHAPIAGKVMSSGGSIYINSAVTGEVQIYAEKLTFGPQAQVTGRIVYKGPQEAVIDNGARVSAIEFTRVDKKGVSAGGLAAIWTLGFLISLLACFVAAWIANHFYTGRVAGIANAIYDRPLKYFGLGFAALILAPILVVILFITFVGYYVALIVLVTYAFLLVVSGLMAVIFVGSALWQWFKKSPQMEFSWRTALLGAVVMSLLKLIPFVGWIICFIIMLMAFGALVSRLRPAAVPAPEVK
jgi:hypothetical protein